MPSTTAASVDVAFDDLVAQIERDGNSVAACKSAIQSGDQRIYERYPGSQDAHLAIAARSALIDRILAHSWNSLIGKSSHALVAVGGYGRGELHPYSDIDLMILLDEEIDEDEEARVGEFVTQLWDFGLDIGHSVRTIAQCVEQSLADVTVITNLIESRIIAGNSSLFDDMLERTSQDRIWSADDFFRAKREEQKKRHIRFQDTSYRLEPNVKESPGGIRDIQTLRWIAKRYFDTDNVAALVKKGFLDKEELQTLQQGEQLLSRIRFMLHRQAGRREDRLLFDHQRDLAHAFGFTVDENNQCIEEFMQGYYRTVMALERLNEMLLQLFEEALPENKSACKTIRLNERFQLNNNNIEVANHNVFSRHPPAMLELFLHISKNPDIEGVRADTIRLIRRHLYLIDDDFRKNPECHRLFIEILANSAGVTHQFRRMNRYGVLAAYLPAFDKIVGRMQYDLFHIYTVDEHTLMVIRNMRRFCIDKHRDEVPHCNDVMLEIEKPELLFLMGLFHDIAKGRGGDHSELGAQDAWEFCIAHGLNTVDAGLVQWAVANHLLMSMTMQRRDVTDPEVVQSFARHVSSKTHLDYLYLLTVADIRGTNPELWNSWKDSLLKTLYQGTVKLLNRGLENPLNKADIIKENREHALRLLADSGIPEEQIEALWRRMGEDYFLRYYADEIRWHTPPIIAHGEQTKPLILIRQDNRFNSTEIFFYCPDQDDLFVKITTVLGRLELNIISARIVTTEEHFALDRFRVLDKHGDSVQDESRIRQIRYELESELCKREGLPPINPRRQTRRMQHFNIPVTVEFDNEITAGLTSVEVTATDRPGVLSHIARSFYECDISVHAAKIATFGEKIEDVFFISHRDGRQVTDEATLRLIESTLIENLSA